MSSFIDLFCKKQKRYFEKCLWICVHIISMKPMLFGYQQYQQNIFFCAEQRQKMKEFSFLTTMCAFLHLKQLLVCSRGHRAIYFNRGESGEIHEPVQVYSHAAGSVSVIPNLLISQLSTPQGDSSNTGRLTHYRRIFLIYRTS